MIHGMDVGLQRDILNNLGVEFCSVENNGMTLLAKVDKNIAVNFTSKEKVEAAKIILEKYGISGVEIKYRTVEKKVAWGADCGNTEPVQQELYLVTPSYGLEYVHSYKICDGVQSANRFIKSDYKKAVKERKRYIYNTDRYMIIQLKPLTKRDLTWLKHFNKIGEYFVLDWGMRELIQEFIQDYGVDIKYVMLSELKK